MEMIKMLAVGNEAPLFSLEDQYGCNICLEDMRGKWVVLFVYVKDLTPG
jgi:peroxiredoxin